VQSSTLLKLIYHGRFLHGSVTLSALSLPTGKTTVMHLVTRENLPEPNSNGWATLYILHYLFDVTLTPPPISRQPEEVEEELLLPMLLHLVRTNAGQYHRTSSSSVSSPFLLHAHFYALRRPCGLAREHGGTLSGSQLDRLTIRLPLCLSVSPKSFFRSRISSSESSAHQIVHWICSLLHRLHPVTSTSSDLPAIKRTSINSPAPRFIPEKHDIFSVPRAESMLLLLLAREDNS